MSTDIVVAPLTSEAFQPFGDVLEVVGAPDMLINRGKCGRFHDRALLDFDPGDDGRAGISLFAGTPYEMPLRLDMMERHPLGSQAFIPMTTAPFLVVVAEDDGGRPSTPLAFRSDGTQGVNYHRNVWHAVLTPLVAPQTFAVVDRIGSGNNLEEYWFEDLYFVRD